MCGGTRPQGNDYAHLDGLSPRVRGNRKEETQRCTGYRSIPACAGEPWNVPSPLFCLAVYPRVCGGTLRYPFAGLPSSGLSPRVRGNRLTMSSYPSRDGSIPACAGEPLMDNRCRSHGMVYPRVCGGTHPRNPNRHSPAGLSPRVRGNRRVCVSDADQRGSIPACAGEPAPSCTLAEAK